MLMQDGNPYDGLLPQKSGVVVKKVIRDENDFYEFMKDAVKHCKWELRIQKELALSLFKKQINIRGKNQIPEEIAAKQAADVEAMVNFLWDRV